MISQTTIHAVFDAARIEEVIGDFVQLKKSGSSLKGLSPFTNERTPSFMVSPVKGIWKDFSSGKGGNVVSFLMEQEHFTYPEAIKWLAKRYNIEVEETEQSDEEKAKQDERESMYLVSKFAASWFAKQMMTTDAGRSIGYSYFKERGFSDDTIKKFGLGYSPDEWTAFTDAALQAGYKEKYLASTGLTIIKEDTDKKFDRFKGRVMFPIKSMSGRVLGFGGRILSDTKKAAKYLNSPESDIYHKSKVLYGLYESKQAIAKKELCYLVEGYTDVIQMHQAGVENVVSSSGTALTPDQIRLINRLTKNITVLFDGDAAGLRASLRGVDLILEQGMNVRVCTFPDGEDPDSFAKAHTTSQIEEYLESNAQDFISFKAGLLSAEAGDDPIKKSDTIREIVSSIALVPDAISREVFVQQTAKIMGVAESTLFASLAQHESGQARKKNQEYKKEQESKGLQIVRDTSELDFIVSPPAEIEYNLLLAIILYGNKVVRFKDLSTEEDENGEILQREVEIEKPVYEKVFLDLHADEMEFTTPDFQSLYTKAVDIWLKGGNLHDPAARSGFSSAEEAIYADILAEYERPSLHRWSEKDIIVKQREDGVAQFVFQTVLTMRRHLIQSKIDELNTLEDGVEHTPATLEEVVSYLKLMRTIDGFFGRVVG